MGKDIVFLIHCLLLKQLTVISVARWAVAAALLILLLPCLCSKLAADR